MTDSMGWRSRSDLQEHKLFVLWNSPHCLPPPYQSRQSSPLQGALRHEWGPLFLIHQKLTASTGVRIPSLDIHGFLACSSVLQLSQSRERFFDYLRDIGASLMPSTLYENRAFNLFASINRARTTPIFMFSQRHRIEMKSLTYTRSTTFSEITV